MHGAGVGRPVRAPAILVVLALAGCAAAPSAPATPASCQGFADCLFTQDGPLPIIVHRSAAVGFPATGLAVLADQVELLAGRTVTLTNGSAIEPVSTVVSDAELSALHKVGGAGELHLYVVDATRLEGEAPTSGLSFPGSSVVFLFPGTLDLRVDEAGLAEPQRTQARATVEGVVLAHEFGHALGLVACGIPMLAPHAHEESSCHSANATSIMQPMVARVSQWPTWNETAPLGPFGWDADDLADLEAFRVSLR
jgi:hypothetical protein